MDRVADYPLLPVRRRLWERLLRVIDSAGTAGQLRTQLKIVHEATRDVAEKPLGTVIPSDAIYRQIKEHMVMNRVMLRDVSTRIDQLNDGTEEGQLRYRLCSLIFMIGKLPREGLLDTGVKATADTLADLLVEDVTAGSAPLRQRVPTVLQDLIDDGKLILVKDEYRLQTPESEEWENRLPRATGPDSGQRSQDFRSPEPGTAKRCERSSEGPQIFPGDHQDATGLQHALWAGQPSLKTRTMYQCGSKMNGPLLRE